MSVYRYRHLRLASGADSEHCGSVKPGVWLALVPPWTITVHSDEIWTRRHQDCLSMTSFINSLVLAGFLCRAAWMMRRPGLTQFQMFLRGLCTSSLCVVFDWWIFFHFHCGVIVFSNVKYLYILFRTWQRKCFSFNKDLFYKLVFWGFFCIVECNVLCNKNKNCAIAQMSKRN